MPDFREDRRLFAVLGRLARSVGRQSFYTRALEIVAHLVPADMHLVMRYSHISRPEFLVARGLDRGMIDLYLSAYYRLDPFYRYWRETRRGGVVSLRDVALPRDAQGAYLRVFAPRARITDDLGIFLPVPGRSAIALFVERSAGCFSPDDLRALRLMSPVLLGLHAAHLNQLLAALPTPVRQGSRMFSGRATLITDHAHNRVFANRAWQHRERRIASLDEALKTLRHDSAQTVELGDDLVLHVDPLARNFAIAPRGWLYTLEEPSRSPVAYRDVLGSFFEAELTPREREIVSMIVLGHSTERIAARLGIGKGTVKNHRRRLYLKLGIGSERELFALFLDHLRRAIRHDRES